MAKGAWTDESRGKDHHDPGNDVFNEWWPDLPKFVRVVRTGDWLSYKNKGNVLEMAAGVSFCAATGERFLIHLDMGRLHFTSIRSRDAWARVWAIFHLLGSGPEVAPECVGFAGTLAGNRIPWTPDDNQRAVTRPTTGSELYDGMCGLHGPWGEALQAVTWGPDDDP